MRPPGALDSTGLRRVILLICRSILQCGQLVSLCIYRIYTMSPTLLFIRTFIYNICSLHCLRLTYSCLWSRSCQKGVQLELHYTILYYTILYYNILYYTSVLYTNTITLYYIILHYVTLYLMLRRVAQRRHLLEEAQLPDFRVGVGRQRLGRDMFVWMYSYIYIYIYKL